jgi:hypothetical protein
VLKQDSSINWAGIISRNGIILGQEARKGADLLLSDEENEEYAASAISRHKTRLKYEPKIGRLLYAFGRYEKTSRATIPMNGGYYLLVIFDTHEKNFDYIIAEKIIPLVAKSAGKFEAELL